MRKSLALQILGSLLFLSLVAGCALQNKESMLVAAGFKVIPATTIKQQAHLQSLPENKVIEVQRQRKIYYVFADKPNNQLYVGGPKQYQAYQLYRLQSRIAEENLEAAEINQETMYNWGYWGPWGGPGFGW